MIKTEKPILTIITVTYNSEKLIPEYFKSLKKYLLPKIPSEIIVIDNASRDKSVSLLEKLAVQNKNFTVFRNPDNRGFAKANNQGAQIAKGKYLLFLNPDTRLRDFSLLKLIGRLERDKTIGLIAPRLLNDNGKPQPSVYRPQTLKNAFLEFFLGQNTYLPYAPQRKTSVHAVMGAAILMRKNLFERLGGWNEKYFMYFEDLDLCRRIKKINKKIIYFPSAAIIHRLGSSSKTLKTKPSKWLVQSSKKYHGFLKYYLLTFIIYLGQKWRN